MNIFVAAPVRDRGAELVAALRARFPQLAAALDQGVSATQALRHFGLIFWREGRLDDAARLLEAANLVAQGNPVVLNELGCLWRALGRKADAMRCFADSLEINPGQVQVWLNAASLSNEIGDKNAAEEAYVQAIQLDPANGEAAAGLGLIHVERRNFGEAARLLTLAAANGVATGPIFACLGQAHYLLGEFKKSSAAFARASRTCPGESWVVMRYARARFAEAVVDGPLDAAIEIYRATAGEAAEDIDAVSRTTFQSLSGFGYLEAALRLGAALLAKSPDDPILIHHLAALRGEACARATPAYVAACFDKYAPEFDSHLVDVLQYAVPAKMHTLIVETGARFSRILDLGCGTGLAAPYFASFGANLTGVDLSPKMLEKARERALYDRLYEAEATEHLTTHHESYDLIAAFDVLVYLGDLAALFDAVAARLTPGGLFAFSYETAGCATYELRVSGRFAHARTYIEALVAEKFETLANVSTTLRLEANAPMAGRLMVLRAK